MSKKTKINFNKRNKIHLSNNIKIKNVTSNVKCSKNFGFYFKKNPKHNLDKIMKFIFLRIF
jgi:hypothetical protein